MTEKINSRRTKFINNRFIKLINPLSAGGLKNDILSGLTVALALVPEAIAFSFVAHVDPTIGLYAAFMMALITSIFGGRPGMISGSTGAVAVIFAPLVISQVEAGGMESALAHLFVAVILMGLMQICFGLLKFGKFVRLIPHPVMLGFVNGLAIVIFRAQFGQFYVTTDGVKELLPQGALVVMLALIILTMAISHFLPKLTKVLPATLTAIVVVTVVSYLLSLAGIESRTVLDFVKDLAPEKTTLKASLPSFAVPAGLFTLATIKTVLPFAALAAAVGLIESLLTLTLVDELTDTRGRGNRECIGQGLANLVNGFFGGMGGCAMIGQSMINIKSGGRGRASGITAALCLLVFVIWGSVLIEIIPLAALVGVMFMVVIATFEWTSIRIINKIPKADAFIIIFVSAVTVLVDLAIAVLAGIIVSALVFAWEHGKNVYSVTEKVGELKIYHPHGPLFFGSVASFKKLFDFTDDPDEIVIDFTNMRVCDHSAIEALNNITDRYAQNDKKLHLLNLSKECALLLDKVDNIVEISIIEDLEWHIAEDKLS